MRKRTVLLGSAALIVAALVVAGYALQPPPAEPFEPTAEEAEQLALYQKPEHWFAENLRRPPVVIDDQHLNPKLQYMSEQMADSGGDGILRLLFAVPPGRSFIRTSVDRNWTLFTKVTAPMDRVEDRHIDGRDGRIPVRMYWPQVASPEPLPILIYAHGGGYLFASVAALDRAVRLMANEAQAIVVSIEYRRAPEHPYPAAADDGEDVFLWVREHAAQFGGDPQRIGFGGDSAGGHVAINVAQRQVMKGAEPPALLLLYYPGVGSPQKDRSYELFAKGYGLDASFFEFLVEKVFPGLDPASANPDDLMEPVRAKNLKGLPPTIVATAGFDIMRDSARTFAGRLRDAGVPVVYRNYPTLTHSFLQFSGVIADAEQAAVETAKMFGEGIRHGLASDAAMLEPQATSTSLAAEQ